jgi:hypothetical protein
MGKGGFSRYFGPGPRVPRRGLGISEGPIVLETDFYFDFPPFLGVFPTIFSLFRKIIM